MNKNKSKFSCNNLIYDPGKCKNMETSTGKRDSILSAGVILCRKAGDRWLFLLLRAYGFWDFPKGIVESGEDPVAAAIRETEEETTITDLDFKWGYDYRDTGPYNNRRKIARYYIAKTKTENISLPINPEIGKPEHDTYRWCQYDEALKIVAPRVRSALSWAYKVITKT